MVSASPRLDQAIEARQSYIGVACTNTMYSNVYGTCQTTSTCSSRTGVADTNPDCLGPDNVQCCILDNCVNGASGTCLDTRQWNCRGSGGWNRYVWGIALTLLMLTMEIQWQSLPWAGYVPVLPG
jgi:hypothetical protein